MDDERQQKKFFTCTSGIRVNYLIYLPEEYNITGRKWPLMLFLHGAGERGNDPDLIKKYGPPMLVEKGKDFPFILISPQCKKNGEWQVDILIEFLNFIIDNYNINKKRIYLTGVSMGGFGTWNLACKFPEKFAAIAPVCGGGNPFEAYKIKNIPTWIFHGAMDYIVPLKKSEEMYNALKKAGGNPKFTVYPETGHDSWTETYNNPEFFDWIINQKKVIKLKWKK